MTEVFFNGLKADVEDTQIIAATYGNISFGEFNKKKGIKTNSFKLPITNRNKEIFENSELVNNDTNIPYTFMNWHVTIFGTQVIGGYAYIRSAKDYYDVETVNGISDFYSEISTRKLNELTLTEYNHTWNKDNIEDSWTNTDGYIYAYVAYGLAWENRRIHPRYILPQIYFHTIVKKIILEAGYTYKGKVFTDLRFLSHIIIYNQLPVKAVFDGPITLNDGLPDVYQSKVLLDFMNIYGLMPDINNDDMVITFHYIDDIIFNQPINWSDKIDDSEKVEVFYSLDYFIESKFSFKTDDAQIDGKTKTISLVDETLNKEGFIYESSFFVASNAFIKIGEGLESYPDNTTNTAITKRGNFISIYDPAIGYGDAANVIHAGNYYQSAQPSGVAGGNPAVEPGTDDEFWKLSKETDLITFKSRPMYGHIYNYDFWPFTIGFDGTYVPIKKVVEGFLLDWSESYKRHYRVFDRIITKTKIVELLMKLNYSDINQLDFTRPYWLDRFNSLMLLEEVRQYKLNEVDSTICRFVRL